MVHKITQSDSFIYCFNTGGLLFFTFPTLLLFCCCICLFVYVPVCGCVSVFVCLSVCVSVCLHIFMYYIYSYMYNVFIVIIVNKLLFSGPHFRLATVVKGRQILNNILLIF